MLLSNLTGTGTISNENVQSIRDPYISNLRWHANHFELVTQWFDTWNINEDAGSGADTYVVSIIIIFAGIYVLFFM